MAPTLRETYQKTIKKKDLFFNRFIARPVAVPIIKLLEPTRVSPNQVTMTSFLVAVVAAGIIVAWPGYWGVLVAAIVFEFSYVLDCADGMLARLRGESSKVGHLFDFLMDEIKAFFLLAAVTTRYALAPDAWPGWWLVGLWGLVALGSSIGLTSMTRREEYSGETNRYDGERVEMPEKSATLVGRLLGFAEGTARWAIHYPSYLLYLGLIGTFIPFLTIYPLVLWVYFVRTLMGVSRRIVTPRSIDIPSKDDAS